MDVPTRLRGVLNGALLRILDDLEEGVVVLEGNRPVFANAAFLSRLGLTPEGLTALDTLLPLVEPSRRESLRKFLDEAAGTRRLPLHHVTRLRTPENGFFPAEIRAEPLEGDRWVLLIRDRSREASLEEAARLQEEQAFQWFQRNPHPMLIYEVDSLAILSANDSAVAHYGWTKEEFASMTLRDVRADRGDAVLEEDLASHPADGPAARRGVLHRRKDGTEFHAETISHSILFRGKDCRLVLVNDVSARVEAEEALRERVRFERLLTQLSTELVRLTPEELDAGLRRALHILTEATDNDSSFIFLFQESGRRMDFLYEWSKPGMPTHRDEFQNAPVEQESWFISKIRSLEPVVVSSLEDVPPEARGRLQALGVRSFVAVPLVVMGKAIGFMGMVRYETPRQWRTEQISLLKVASEMFANALERKRQEDRNRRSSADFRAVLENGAQVVVLLDGEGRIKLVNRNASEFSQRFAGRAWKPGDGPDVWMPPGRLPGVEEAFRRALGGKILKREIQLRGPDGLEWWKFHFHPVRDDQEVIGVCLTAYSIEDHKATEEALRHSEEKFRNLFHLANDTIFLYEIAEDGTPGRIEEVNDVACRRLGYSREELLALSPVDLVDPGRRKDLSNYRRILLERGHVTYEEEHRTRLGLYIPVEVSAHRFRWKGRDYVLSIARDITERKLTEETIRRQAYYDLLTSLPNRMLFKDRLVQAMAHAKRNRGSLAIMLLDVDRFKTINETLGHVLGDKLLIGVADRLLHAAQEGETLARLGGDEFIFLIPQLSDADEVALRAKAVLEVLQKPFRVGKHELHLTSSLGIAVYPSDGNDPDVLLKNAETAMYRAKEQGRNNYQMYTSIMNAKAFKRLVLENSLRRAVERREFVVYYQPQVELTTGRLVGLEALVRWRHPDLGLVFPTEFIGLAEETGLILPLGEIVLRESCRQAKAWQVAGYPCVPVSVNLSARQFVQHDLVDQVAGILRETGLDPKFLELEITESVAMRNAEFSASVLEALRGMGVAAALDDFGTGYSSLNYLKTFPIRTLKIDKSFVSDLLQDPNDAAIVQAVIALAHSLKLRVVAEGVEKEGQLEFLRKNGCDLVQGYLVSHPLPVDEFEKLLKKDKLL